ncbi:hypothetical protein LDENG_00273500 [Lucifuga dentata]|nr:hypothetical protein LDENG_00273500 [Lucifuga dentata]
MMDFDNILSLASQNQGLNNVQKRYSLQAGPPKKDPKGKCVNAAAVQALIQKQLKETKIKEIQMKRQKEDLLAKRVELKSDRKARAMASRTKDNFRGYNGIPVVEGPKKRRTKAEMLEEKSRNLEKNINEEKFRNHTYDPEDDEDNYKYEQSDSEPEPEPLRPGKSSDFSGNSSSKLSSSKPAGLPKPGPPAMNFADLLKLAEKKQFEPVELKPKVARKEERLRTAEEIREIEMERKAKRQDRERNSRTERERDSKSQSSSVRKSTLEKEQKNLKLQKNLEKYGVSSSPGKNSNPAQASDKGHGSKSYVSDRERERPKTFHSDRDRPKSSLSSSSGAFNSKVSSQAALSQVSTKQGGPRPSPGQKSSTSSDLSYKKENSSQLKGRPGGIPGSKLPSTSVMGQKSHLGSSQHSRPIQGSSLKQAATVGQKPTKGEPSRPGSNSAVKSSSNALMRHSSGGPPKPGTQSQTKPGGSILAKVGGVPQARPGVSNLQGRSGVSGIGPGQPGNGGRPAGNVLSGPERPKCTVVSETISSKNVGGPKQGVLPRSGMPQTPGIPQRLGIPQRPGIPQRGGIPPRPMNRPPGTMLPPITHAYKRKYEDEDDYDSEMDDFIDDGDNDQEEVSKHIRQIFGYDRHRYKDESDYALKFMESSWKDLQKEEARSLKLAVQEDLEEERREEEELRKKRIKVESHLGLDEEKGKISVKANQKRQMAKAFRH